MGPCYREVEMMETALAESHGRISGPSGAGAKLGIPRQTLESKIRRLGIYKYGQKRQIPNSITRLHLGRTITSQDIPVEPWRDELLKRGLPVHLVNHLATMGDLHRAGCYDRMSDDVLTLTGQQPLSVQEFVRKMRRHLPRRQKQKRLECLRMPACNKSDSRF